MNTTTPPAPDTRTAGPARASRTTLAPDTARASGTARTSGTSGAAGHARRRGVSPRTGFWFVAVAFAVLMAFGTAPTPLWPLYQDRDGFGATTVTLAFAIMVVGAAVGFLGLGHLSDRWGRRRIIVPALLTDVAAASLLVLWPGLPGLLTARLLTGLAVGLMASTATAYLMDLWHRAHPGQPLSTTPGLVATVSNLGGLALGPLLVGVLAQWSGSPLVTPFVLFGAVMLVLLVLVLAAPETVDTAQVSGTRPARFALREGARPVFAAAAATGFFAFAATGLFSALGAVIVRQDLGSTSPLVAGTVTFVVFGASVLAQLLLGRLPVVGLLRLGALLFPLGLGLTAVTLYVPSLALLLLAAVLSGSGSGLLFKASVDRTAAAAAPTSRAGVLAVFFVVAYVGMGAPSVLFGLAANHFGRQPVMLVFAVLLSVGTAVAAWTAVRASAGGRARTVRPSRIVASGPSPAPADSGVPGPAAYGVFAPAASAASLVPDSAASAAPAASAASVGSAADVGSVASRASAAAVGSAASPARSGRAASALCG
ncbi:MFS transporter [Streptomyces sp. CA-294286]|uniref:MFS transporter n=1 Tax=Streptomyces sp. CA-294286 TaxID=3240070 RepID=UPI003D8AC68D